MHAQGGSPHNAIRNYAAAITETATPELKAALREQLNLDLTVADTAINLAQKMGQQ
ncbi:spore coat protein [Neobacillus citreus]|uniref:Spore coat protein n=1 Tax=Neobacillus citreus TaxID=2833578 RepID=A0A942YBR5_9BACI|nr:spore coat protein [Neobacillus citreus]MCH6266047.1 spore coat protein [Neobacillus citreus]